MENMNIKVRELLGMEIDIDTYDDYDETLGIAFCGPAELTEEGKEEFAEILELDVTMYYNKRWDCYDTAVVHITEEDEQVQKAADLFNMLAGYWPDSIYKKYVKED